MTAEQPITARAWQEVELSFTALASYASPYTETEFWAEFTHSDGTVLRRPGCWDGGDSGKIRFAFGSPALLIGDTAWALPWRATPEQCRTYAADRRTKGFNAALPTTDIQPDWECVIGRRGLLAPGALLIVNSSTGGPLAVTPHKSDAVPAAYRVMDPKTGAIYATGRCSPQNRQIAMPYDRPWVVLFYEGANSL